MNYKQYITGTVLKFWIDNAIDKESGGMDTCTMTERLQIL